MHELCCVSVLQILLVGPGIFIIHSQNLALAPGSWTISINLLVCNGNTGQHDTSITDYTAYQVYYITLYGQVIKETWLVITVII